MKKLAFLFAFMTFCGLGFAQDADTTMAETPVVDSAAMAQDTEAAAMAEAWAAYEKESNEALQARIDAKNLAVEKTAAREKVIWNWRIWTIIILLGIGVIKGGFGYLGYLNHLKTAKPEVYHVYPNPAKDGKTKLQLSIPENSFTASLTLKDFKGNTHYSQEVDNSVSYLDVDFSDVEPGTYNLRLEGAMGSSKKKQVTIS